MAEQNVTVNPGESKIASFETTPLEAKTYHISVNGLVGSFIAIAPVGLIGDLNDDGVINVLDLTLLERYIAGLDVNTPLSPEEFLRRADVNGDGNVNSLDITALERLIAGEEPSPNDVAEFVYVAYPTQPRPGAPTRIFQRHYLNRADYITVDVKNIGAKSGICILTFSTQYKLYKSGVGIPKPPWVDKATISHVIDVGEIVTFGDNQEWVVKFPFHGDTWQGYEIHGKTLKVSGDPGEHQRFYKHFA